MESLTVVVRRTSYTPQNAHVGPPGLFPPADGTRINVSVIFTQDLPAACQIRDIWKEDGYSVWMGGPACDDPGGEFTPGKFVRLGVTITSRGCPRKCPWCYVAKREGPLREIGIHPGYIVQDNNLLACSNQHISSVFEMLKTQRAIKFKGGIDPRLLKYWHIEALRGLRIDEIWLSADHRAYHPSSVRAIERLKAAGFSQQKIRCYVMVGYEETLDQAQERVREIFRAGALPFTQLYDALPATQEWKKFVNIWSRPARIFNLMKREGR